MPPSSSALLAAAIIAVCASTPCNQVYDTVKGRLEISSPLEGGECSALVLPPWHYPEPKWGLQEAPLVEVVNILDASGRVVCAGAMIAPDWVLTAGTCADAASEVLLLGLQRVSIREVVLDLRGGAEAVALLRLEHAVCSRAQYRMDDGSNIGAGSCRSLQVEMVETSSPLGAASPVPRWNETMRCVPFDNRTADVQTWVSDMMDANPTLADSTDNSTNRSAGNSPVWSGWSVPSHSPVSFAYGPASGCPNEPASSLASASPLLCATRDVDLTITAINLTINARRPLLGSPLVARGAGEPRAGGVLVGVLTDSTDASSLKVARVSSVQHWVLAVANLSTHPPRKLIMEVTSFYSRGTATAHVHRGPSPHDADTTLESDCDMPVSEDDGGRGGILVRIKTNSSGEEGGDNATRLLTNRDPLPPSLVAAWRAITCDENWQAQGGSTASTPEQCNNPNAGGILGCAHIPAQDAQNAQVPAQGDQDGRDAQEAGGGREGGACVEAGCKHSLAWKEVRVLERAGRATVGGLGQLAIKSGAKRYTTWMCVRGWDAHVQQACGAGPSDYSCWRFEEEKEEWAFLGLNRDVHMVMPPTDKKLRARERAQRIVFESVLPTTYPPPPGCMMAGYHILDGDCVPCSAGHFKLSVREGTCLPCPEDTYKNWTGVGECHACPLNFRADPGSRNCTCTATLVPDGSGGCMDPTFFDLAAPDYPSSHTYPGTYATRALIPNEGYNAGSDTFSVAGGHIPGNHNYCGGVLGANGKVYFVPRGADDVGVFDPATGVFSAVDISNVITGNNKYVGGVLALGKLYFAPWHAESVGIFDPETDAFSALNISGIIDIKAKYGGCVLAATGTIIFVPLNAPHVGVLDPATNVFSVVDISATVPGSWKYQGGALAPNGKVYFVPRSINNVGVFDPSTNAFSTVDISAFVTGNGKYNGAVLAPNGKIYFTPRNRDNVGVFDPATNAFTIINIPDSFGINGTSKFAGGVLAPNGKIYFAPWDSNSFGILDPSTDAFSLVDISAFKTVKNKYWGGVLAPNGTIVFVPVMMKIVGVVDPGNSAPAYRVSGGVPQEWRALLSPHFNKY